MQDDKASGDAASTAVAVVLFRPAELGRLKGEMDAVEQASICKNCGLRFSRTPVASSQHRRGHGYRSNSAYPTGAPSANTPDQQRCRL